MFYLFTDEQHHSGLLVTYNDHRRAEHQNARMAPQLRYHVAPPWAFMGLVDEQARVHTVEATDAQVAYALELLRRMRALTDRMVDNQLYDDWTFVEARAKAIDPHLQAALRDRDRDGGTGEATAPGRRASIARAGGVHAEDPRHNDGDETGVQA